MNHLTFLVLGLGSGAVIALLAIGIVVTHRASRVVNFAHAAIGMYVAFVYYEFRATGDVVLPILGLPARVPLVPRPTVVTALVVALVLAALLGALLYLLVFRFLRDAPALARVVASLGLLLYLIAIVGLRFGSTGAAALVIEGPLPDQLITIGSLRVPADRYILAAIAIAVTAVLWAGYRLTRLGLSTRAVADNEYGAVLVGISPTTVGVLNWMLGSVLAALVIVLAAPVIRLDPSTTSLLVVPAIAAALPGRLDSLWVALFTGLGIGMLQSELLNLQREWEWLPDVGLQQGIPFLVILLSLMVRGGVLPGRGDIATNRLPRVPAAGHNGLLAVASAAVAIVATLLVGSEWRTAIIVSAIGTIVALSVVVITGYVGQISLAIFAIAGIAAFSTVRFLDNLSIPFPLAPILGVGVAVVAGQIAGLPAIRVRGLNLAIATLAAAVAVEELVFKLGWFTGGLAGSTVESPSLFGIDLGISAVGDAFPRKTFGVIVILLAAIAMIMVGNIRSGTAGRRWLAVRANERAASASGINVAQAKLSAFAVSSALAGVAGVLLAYQRTIVSVGSFVVFASLVTVALTYLAGITSPVGALVAGTLTAGGLLTVLLNSLSDGASEYQFAVSGLFLVVAAIRIPTGITGLFTRGG